MITSKRCEEILNEISQTGYSTVAQLAATTFTSPSTVRRSLDELERLGYIKRVHGGAELVGELSLPVSARSRKNTAEKAEIARHASQFIKNAKMIFVDNASTCAQLLPYLPRDGAVVWTNGAKTGLLFGEAGIKVRSTGGRFNPVSLAYVGEYAIETIRRVKFDAMFFSSSAFDGDMISDFSEPDTLFRRAALAQAKRRYFLCDTSKFGHSSEFILCGSTEVDAVITENGVLPRASGRVPSPPQASSADRESVYSR